MSDEPDNAGPESESIDEEDRRAILDRRGRFIKAAMASLAGASIVAACGGDTTDPADAGNPSPCLSPSQQTDASQADGSGTDGSKTDGSQIDATPQPCLEPPLPDSGLDDAVANDAGPDDGFPQPCLAPPPG